MINRFFILNASEHLEKLVQRLKSNQNIKKELKSESPVIK